MWLTLRSLFDPSEIPARGYLSSSRRCFADFALEYQPTRVTGDDWQPIVTLTNRKTYTMKITLAAGLAAALAILPRLSEAQTVISGPNIMTSTWSPAGNPYIITADCTVPSGQTLTVQPGTIIWMGSGTSLTGNGVIQAVGTAAQRITFQPPISSQIWNTIVLNNTVGTNQFKYCDFSNATNALDFRGASKNEITSCNFVNTQRGLLLRDSSVNLVEQCTFDSVTSGIWMTVFANNWTQTTSVRGCLFTNSSAEAVYGEAAGTAAYYYSQTAQLLTSIKNCSFNGVAAGCRFHVAGGAYLSLIGSGYGDLQIANNEFNRVTNSALRLTVGSYGGGGSAALVNTTVVSAGSGITTQDPWDAKVQNNIFKSCGIGVTRSGTLSATVSYNDLFSNLTNFTGYPVTYGQVILANRNGTPCDVLFNIYSDPLFVSPTDFHLQAVSPCIDAGEGSGANFDSYFPPSLGSITNDIGAYGGPSAGQWIVPPSTNAFTLGITRVPYVSVTVDPPSPGHYRLEYASALLGTNTWIQITNLDLTTIPFTYTEPVTSPARFYRAVRQ